MFKQILTAAVIGCGVLTLVADPGRVIEIRKKVELNPELYFSGVSGNPELTTQLRTFFGVCGWFRLTDNAAAADYTVAAAVSGGMLQIQLFQGQEKLAAWRFPLRAAAREVAKSVVDTVIERTFAQLKVRGFCRSKIAFSAQTAPGVRNIFTCDIDGGNVEQITSYRCMNVEPCWGAGGRSICFSKYNRAGIDIVETTVAKPRRSRIISSFRGLNTGAAVSPDGSKLAAILSPDHKVDLYVLGLRQKSKQRLTNGAPLEASPCWSPDGSQLAFVSDRSGVPRIYVGTLAGIARNAVRQLPTIGSDAVTPAWSGDGKIAYATRINGEYTIAVYDLATGENKRVTEAPGNWESPEWAADNRQVVCKRSTGGTSTLCVLDTRTGRDRLLLRTGSKLFDPTWSPCTRR